MNCEIKDTLSTLRSLTHTVWQCAEHGDLYDRAIADIMQLMTEQLDRLTSALEEARGAA